MPPLTRSALRYLATLCAFLAYSISIPNAAADQAARIYSVEGAVEVRDTAVAPWRAAQVDMLIQRGGSLRTGSGSRAAVMGADGIMVRIGPHGLVEWKGGSDATHEDGIHVGEGSAHFLSRDPHTFPNVTTSVVSGTIRGTEFSVTTTQDESAFTVMNGVVEARTPHGVVTLQSGEQGFARSGEAPRKSLIVNPFDTVQWAFRYPRLISPHSLRGYFAEGTPEQQRGFQELLAGNIDVARTLFRGTTSRDIVGRMLCDRAHGRSINLLPIEQLRVQADPVLDTVMVEGALEQGEVAYARQVHALMPDVSTSTPRTRAVVASQRAVVAIVGGYRSEAHELLQEAERLDPEAAPVRMVRALHHQGRGAFDEARRTIEDALHDEPENIYLLTQSAELAFGAGDIETAGARIAAVLERAPRNVSAMVIRALVYLAEEEVDAAFDLIHEALQIDSAYPEAHFAYGLALFRRNQRTEARIELQKAVHLAPTVALYRSYLGKAFFENEDEAKAREEFALAKKLDPNDPTPYLYDAFTALAQFQPVDALDAVEESIRLNDNRAVYRSRSLLDRDHATRGTGLGRVFSALDFTQPARVEALKSLVDDPSNYAAHLLYRDSLQGSANSLAATTEEVTVGLLSPATFSSLLATASDSTSLNSYSTLFERGQSRTVLDVVGQSKAKLVESSAVHFGGGDNYSYLMRVGQLYSDGYRNNDFERRGSGRTSLQYDITPNDKLLMEGIVIGSSQGDLFVSYDPSTNDPDKKYTFEDYTGRLGYRHSWGPRSHTIGQVIGVNSRLSQKDSSFSRSFPISFVQDGEVIDRVDDQGIFSQYDRQRVRGIRGDVQHLWSTERFSLVSGASLFEGSELQRADGFLANDAEGILQNLSLSSRETPNSYAFRGYSYLTVRPAEWVRVIGGGNVSDVRSPARTESPYVDTTEQQSRFNPKAGVMVFPTERLTLRGAYFEALGAASMRSIEELEPTQVAGIRQSFDDPLGARSKNLGFGADYKLPGSTYVGAEYLARQIAEPWMTANEGLVVDTATGGLSTDLSTESVRYYSHEQAWNGYLNHVLTRRSVARLEHALILSDLDSFNERVTSTKNTAAGQYFSPSGFFAFTSATWRTQRSEDLLPESNGFESFWRLRAGIGQQLPHRHGAVQLSVGQTLGGSYRYLPTSFDENLYPGTDVSLGVNLNF